MLNRGWMNQYNSDNVVSELWEVAPYQRPGHVESTVSRPITEVKLCWAGLLLVRTIWKAYELLLQRFPCTSRHGPSDAKGSGWPRVRGWTGWATDVEGFGEWDGEIGIGLSVGRGGRLTSRESCLWAAADFADFSSRLGEATFKPIYFDKLWCPTWQ